jgi:hypothetical protein
LDAVKLAAHKAHKKGEKILIGFETSAWVPEAQQGAIQPLIAGISRIKDELAKMGLDNIIIIRDAGDALASAIERERVNSDIGMKNIVVLASEKTLSSGAFDGLRSTETDERAFFAGIDPANISDLSYIRLMEMLDIAMRLAFKDTIALTGHPDIIVQSIGARLIRLIPKAEPKSYEELKGVYEAQRKALEAA